MTERDLRALPKANLHLHLTGAMRPTTLRDLAERYGIALPDAPAGPASWHRFQTGYDAAREAIRTTDDVHRVIREAAEDNAADGAVWLEIQVDPTSYAARLGAAGAEAREGMAAVVSAAVTGARLASDAVGIGVDIVIASSWARSRQHAELLAGVAADFAGRGVVGFGLSNDERRGEVRDFRSAFRLAADAGLMAVPHAGSFLGAWHVRECVELLGATRIGHGFTAATDNALVTKLATERITLEICPSAYPAVGLLDAVTALPLPRLLAAGVPVALGTDDPLFFGAGLSDQYAMVREAFDLTDLELAELARGSIRGSAAPSEVTTRELKRIDEWLN